MSKQFVVHTPSEVRSQVEKTRQFVIDKIIPYESDPRWEAHGPTEPLRHEIQDLARHAGVFGPHIPREFGGLGMNWAACSQVFQAAGYSILGPVALHCAAPDEGNLHLLDVVTGAEQRERYLRPLATGERSCFCMTEPGGAGSDPSMLQTTATFDSGQYVIDGDKWLITGAEGASFTIVMAKMAGGPHDGKATMFLAPMSTPGISLVRRMDTMDSSFPGGHWVVRFDGVRIGADAVLGEIGEGFRYAQVRLAPARLTHCMRWLGAAQRAHDCAVSYAATRQGFGKPIGQHEGVGFMLADNAMDLHVCRLALEHAAGVLDAGDQATTVSSMTKVICSEAIWRVVDRSMQILGGAGISGDYPVERIFKEVRGFRIYDGPSEVHRWSLAGKILKAA